MVGVVLGLHRPFFIYESSIKENIFIKKYILWHNVTNIVLLKRGC